MSSDAAAPLVSVRGVGKRYRIYASPQDRLKHSLFWRLGRSWGRDFWALHDVSLDVAPGEAVGIVGRNGSGKSTLLQMIAGTLTPTEGEVEVRGRVSALLELGSGFNPEFTGRENVFLGGAILGIGHDEMQARFDDVAGFADIGDFIDQPVKTYSSGMLARLAFSVSVSVDPDLLIVDEILAVGDAGFQQRCLARLRRLRERGLTLLFVSHAADSVKSLCDRVLYLVSGRTRYFGESGAGVDLYYKDLREDANRHVGAVPVEGGSPELPAGGTLRYGSGGARIRGVELLDGAGEPCRAFDLGAVLELRVRVEAVRETENLSVSFLVRDSAAVDLAGTTTFDEKVALPRLAPGESATVQFRFSNCFRAGGLGISVAVTSVSERGYSDNVTLDQIDGAAWFRSLPDPDRPVHYKVHVPVEARVLEADG